MRISLFVLIAWAGMAHAAIHFVPDDFISLQDGLDGCPHNDTLVCRDGTYRGPFFIWARNITIASEYILTQNPFHINNCIIRPGNGAHHRCFDTQAADSTNTALNMIGMTISLGRAIEAGDDQGGGLRVVNRTAIIQDCIFKSNAANRGGAIYADCSRVSLHRCSFPSNDSRYYGSTFYVKRSEFNLDSCDIGPSGAIVQDDNNYYGEFHLDSGAVTVRNTQFHDIGLLPMGSRNLFWCYMSQTSLYVRLTGCTIENCNLRTLAEGSASIIELRMDSCVVRDNVIWFGFFMPWMHPQMQYASLTRTWFENNTYPANTGGNGLVAFTYDEVDFVCEDNYFIQNDGASYSCLMLRDLSNPLSGRAQRNYFVENRSGGYQIHVNTPILLDRVNVDSVFEYNAMMNNDGLGLYTLDWLGPTSYALHNYWGDSTGPYEATRNPGGLGDTTNAATIYDEWLQSEDEIPDTSQFPDAVEEKPLPIVSTWRLGNVYPNPFNSEFRVELDGMTGADFEIRMFDLLGREVALLHSGRTLRGTLSFSAPPNLAAGIYFLRGRDHLYTETKKVLYLK